MIYFAHYNLHCKNLLQADNELSIEELRRKYAELAANAEPMEEDSAEENESMDVSDDEEEDEAEDAPQQKEEMKANEQEKRETDEEESEDEMLSDDELEEGDEEEKVEEEQSSFGLETLMEENFEKDSTGDSEKADKELQDASAVAEALQPKGFTLSSTSVTTPIPFLLKHMLREYQHVGLDWLTTMYEKKLNGNALFHRLSVEQSSQICKFISYKVPHT